MAEVGTAVASLLASYPPLMKEAWIRMWEWYKYDVDHSLPPSRVAITTMTSDRFMIYRQVPPPGQPIPVRVPPFLLNDSIPENKEITWAVRRLHLNHPGSSPGMRAEYLRQWFIDATQDNIPDSTNWQKVFAIVQAEFRNGVMSEESICQTVAVIPRGASRDFREIGLVKVLWKYFTSLLNRRLASFIKFHDVLHRFCAGRGTGTASLEGKLLQHLMAIRLAVLFGVLLDLQKAYDDLYW